MKLYELIMMLCERLELMDQQLLWRARASWNPGCGTLDGNLAGQLLDRIRIVLPSIDDDLKRNAYNEIADAEGLDRIEEAEVDFDLSIYESLLDQVIDMLMEEAGGKLQ